jgi:hypothetical protein
MMAMRVLICCSPGLLAHGPLIVGWLIWFGLQPSTFVLYHTASAPSLCQYLFTDNQLDIQTMLNSEALADPVPLSHVPLDGWLSVIEYWLRAISERVARAPSGNHGSEVDTRDEDDDARSWCASRRWWA